VNTKSSHISTSFGGKNTGEVNKVLRSTKLIFATIGTIVLQSVEGYCTYVYNNDADQLDFVSP
jgi:hypothetical protein